jgi:hypothetical protein
MDSPPQGELLPGETGPEGWRLVCHNCGYKWPQNAAANPSGCCQKPKVHVHDTSKPCTICHDYDRPICSQCGRATIDHGRCPAGCET